MRRLQRELGQEDLAGRPADRLSGRCGEHNAAERYVLLADDVMEHVKRAFAVAESGDATGIDGVAPGQDADGRYELFEVRAHAQLAERRPGILGGVRAGGPLVVANRRHAGVRKRLGEEPAAAVGAGEQRGAPITVGGPTTGNEHHGRERTVAVGNHEGATHGDAIQPPGDFDRTRHARHNRMRTVITEAKA